MSGSPHATRAHDQASALLALPFLLLLMLRLFLSLIQDSGWWGLDYAGYLPSWQLFLVTALGVAAAIPAAAARLSRTFDRMAAALFPAQPRSALWTHITLALAFGILAFVMTMPFPFLGGDGVHVMRRLFRFNTATMGAYGQLNTEPLSVLLYAGLGKLFASGPGTDGIVNLTRYTLLFRVVGAAGAGFLALCTFRYAGKLAEDRTDRLALVSMLLFTAGSLFYFGYVEFYAPVFTAAGVLLLSGMYVQQTRTRPVLPVLVSAAAIAFHLSALVFLPAVLVLLFRTSADEDAGRLQSKPLRLQLLLLVLALAGTVYVYAIGIEGPWIALSGGEARNTLLSAVHIRDVANNILLVAPAALAALLIIVPASWKSAPRLSTTELFMLSAVTWCLVLLVSQPAFAHDWDIFAVFGLAVSAFAWLLHLRIPRPQLRKYLRVQLIAQPALFLLPWLLLHVNQDAAVRRYADLTAAYTGILPAAVVAGFHETLRSEAVSRSAGDEEIRHIAVMIELTGDRYEYMKLLRAISARREGVAQSLPDVRRMLQRIRQLPDSTLDRAVGEDAEAGAITLRQLYPSLVTAMGAALEPQARIAWLEESVEAAVRFGRPFSILAQLGHLAFEANALASAGEWYSRAIEDSLFAPDDDGSALSLLHSRLGIVQFSGTLREAALLSFLHATTYPAAEASAWSNLGFAYFRMARFQQSIAPFTRALLMDSTDVNALYCLGRMRMARPETEISGRWLLGRFLLLEEGTRRSGEIDTWLNAAAPSM